MTNASTIPVKVSVVKKLAKLERDFQLTCLRTDVLNVAKDFEAYARRQNESWWRKLTGKFVEVPNPEKLTTKWYDEQALGKLHWESPAGWKFQRTKSDWWKRLKQLEIQRTKSDWWKRLKQLENLPEETEGEIMMLSIEDARLIELNNRWEKAQ